MSYNLKPNDPFTGFLSKDTPAALEVLKSECIMAALTNTPVAKILQKLPVQLFIRRLLTRGDSETLATLISLGYKPASTEDIWLIIENEKLTTLITANFPKLQPLLSQNLNRKRISHQTLVLNFLHEQGNQDSKISKPADFKPTSAAARLF